VTHDHVPPKSFFPQPRPSNLITVPSCNDCNGGAAKDEDYFFATFMFSDAGITSPGKALWKQRLHSMFSKSDGVHRTITTRLTYQRITRARRVYLGRRITPQFDERRLERVIRKIARGLYYFEFEETLPAETGVAGLFLSTKARFAAAIEFSHQLNWGKRQWPGIFEYRCARMPGNPLRSIWLMRCYSYKYFWAISGADQVLKKSA
jgi:hypothetical protein